jgi:hypothetical protein
MKYALLVCFAVTITMSALPSLADSIPPPTPTVSFTMTGIGSGMIGAVGNSSPAEIFSSGFSKVQDFNLTAYSSGNQNWGGTFYELFGSNNDETAINLHGGFSGGTFSNGILTSAFSGVEFERVSPGNWVFWRVTGAIAEGMTFAGAPGTGSITLSSAVFEGRYAVGAEPSTYLLWASGLLGIFGLKRRSLKLWA